MGIPEEWASSISGRDEREVEGMSAQDQELVDALQACARQDHEAFARLYALTAQPLFALTKRIVHDKDLAHDVLQRAYLSIWRKAESFDDSKGRAFTWLLSVVRHEAIDEWRRMKRRRGDEELQENVRCDGALPEQQTELRLVRTLLHKELDSLPPNMARVIRRRFLKGQSVQDISRDISVPANTVRSWIRRGLEMLRHAVPFDAPHAALSIA